MTWFGFLDMFCEEHLFWAKFWILDLFSKIQKFGRSGRRSSIVVGVPRGRRELVPRVRSYFSCFARRTIFYMVHGFVVRTPCRTMRSFCRSGVRFPGPTACIQARGIRGLCHSPPRMEHQVAPQTKKTLLKEVKKLVCMGSGPVSYGEVEGDLHM